MRWSEIILIIIGVLVVWTVLCFIDGMRWKNNFFRKLEQMLHKGPKSK